MKLLLLLHLRNWRFVVALLRGKLSLNRVAVAAIALIAELDVLDDLVANCVYAILFIVASGKVIPIE